MTMVNPFLMRRTSCCTWKKWYEKMKNSVILGAIFCLVPLCYGHAQDIKLGQLGFYPQAEKIAIIPGGVVGESFYITDQVAYDTVYTGVIRTAGYWELAKENVGQANFSDFMSPGVYKITSASGSSHPFEIGSHIYESLLKASIKSYYYQRASTELLPIHAGEYKRDLAHPDDRVLVHPKAATEQRPAGTTLRAPRGWYDAGDYNKYVVNSGISTYTLLAALEYFGETLATLSLAIPESENQVPDVLDEVKWNLDWMLTMQDPHDGGVYHKLTSKEFSGFVTPGKAIKERYVMPKTTAATLNFAAVMAQASRVFAAYEQDFPGFSRACGEAALKAWKWSRINPARIYDQPADVTTGEYGDDVLSDEFQWAATELFVTTRRDSFYTFINLPSITATVPSWRNVSTLSLISLARHHHLLPAGERSRAKKKLLDLAGRLLATYRDSPYKMPFGGAASDFVWGSNGLAANQGVVLLASYYLTEDKHYLSAAMANMDYLLGRNPLNYCFVTGFGKKSPLDPHHRPSFSDHVTAPVPGFLVGGPNPGQQDKCTYPSDLPALSYTDDVCSYASNEVAINWNAPLVFLLAGIIQAYGSGRE